MPREEGHLIIDGISYIPSNALSTGIPKFTFKENQVFGVLDPCGEATRAYYGNSECGIYFNDTRYLAIWEATFNGAPPIPLAQELRFSGNTLVFSMSNRDLPKLDGSGRIPRDTFLFRRILTFSENILYETLLIRNFDIQDHLLQIEFWAGSKFDDIFEVRGYARPKRGKMLSPGKCPDLNCRNENCPTTLLSYEGLDGKTRKTYIYHLFSAEKIRQSPSLSGYFSRILIPAKEDVCLKSILSFDQPSHGKFIEQPFEKLTVLQGMNLLAHQDETKKLNIPQIETDNAILNRAIQNAAIDINSLMTLENSTGPYPYAGIPWFSAPFGRDGIITAYQMLPWYPKLAQGVLDYVFSRLGKKVDAFTDEQPGKVFHEMRRGEMANTREIPFIPYYGSVDATPLSLILLYEYISWTLDMDRLKQWWPQALRALVWIDKWGDSDQDGFVEYTKQSPNGLVNQGWKDSGNSIMHSDGRLANAPIRLCEVQGYVFQAKQDMARLARLMGNNELASRLRLEALQLKTQFLENFWDFKKKYIYLAIDGNQKPCEVRTSNMGHTLWSQILAPSQAKEVARNLMSEALFSGYGIRTLADTEISYNPMSYHNGSIWPHDNSIILEGFRNYGFLNELEQLSHAFIEVLEVSRDFRLPELYCGFRKRGSEPPVPYEVACKPQAWAAGSVFLLIKSMLGLSMDPDQNHLVFHSPILTQKVNRIEIKRLRGRDWELDLVLERAHTGTGVTVTRKSGNVRVLTVK